jgi:hypothetical protein
VTTLSPSPAGAARHAVKTKTLLACGAIAGPLFTLTSILEGHYELAVEVPAGQRLTVAFDDLALAI